MRGLSPWVLILAACGGPSQPTSPRRPPTPAAETRAELAGARCQGGICSCRSGGADDEETSAPEEGRKRFEFRVGTSPGTAWVIVDKGEREQRLYKSGQRAEDCFYLDLAPGPHEIVVRGKAAASEPEGGVGLMVRIAEYHPGGPAWYDAFRFECGFPGPCDVDTLKSWKREAERNRRSYRDPCGTSRITALGWETGRMPDAQHPEEVQLRFTLHVGQRAPEHPPEDPTCPEI